VLVNDADLEVAKPLLRVWFELATLAVLGRNPTDPNNLHTWLIVDELKTIGQLPSLPSILDKGRKYRASVVLGFQAISQVQKIYGEDDARSILQGLQNQFFFRMTEVESAEYVSDLLGEQDVQKPVFTSGFGAAEYGNRGSVTQSLVKQKLVLPEEICRLETLKAYAKLSGQRPFPIAFEVKNRARVNEGAISEINEEQTERFTTMLAEACQQEEAKMDAEKNEIKPEEAAKVASETQAAAAIQQPPQQAGNGFVPGKLKG
jgi:type IV secretory pathway TraG/TraD family ATPase VirD4